MTRFYDTDENSPCGGATASDWVQLVLNIISLNVAWWLFDIPKLFKRERRGWPAVLDYINSVGWQCLRFMSPSLALAYALLSTQDRKQWPARYYYGFDKDSWEVEPITKFGCAKILAIDFFAIASSVYTVVQYCLSDVSFSEPMKIKSTTYASPSGLESIAYATPSLPVAIYGLSVLALVKIKAVKTRFQIFVSAMIVAFVVGGVEAAAIGIVKGGRALILPIPLYFILAAPWILLVVYWPNIVIFLLLFVGYARVAGVTHGAFSGWVTFPFCKLRNDAFGGTNLAFGIIAGFIAWYAIRGYWPVLQRSSLGFRPDADCAPLRDHAVGLLNKGKYNEAYEVCRRILADPNASHDCKVDSHLILAYDANENYVGHAEQAVEMLQNVQLARVGKLTDIIVTRAQEKSKLNRAERILTDAKTRQHNAELDSRHQSSMQETDQATDSAVERITVQTL